MADKYKNVGLYLLGFIVCFCVTIIVFYVIGAIVLINKSVEIQTIDYALPEISLLGDPQITIHVGDDYDDPGASSDTPVVTSGRVNNNIPGNYLISYATTDSFDNTSVTSRVVTVLPKSTGVIYLTFDDGPSPYTAELLDVLAKYNVKATFFVTNAGSDEMLVREYNQGHAIGLHSCTHDYSYIYTSVDNFFADLYCVQDRVKNATGYTSYLMRFPGGSSNLVSASYDGGTHIMSTLTREVEARGFTYFDWNVTSGDAGGTTSSDGVYYNVINRVYSDGKSVVLQHDIKSFSVAAVERIIIWGLENGFTFDKLTADSFTAHHGVNN